MSEESKANPCECGSTEYYLSLIVGARCKACNKPLTLKVSPPVQGQLVEDIKFVPMSDVDKLIKSFNRVVEATSEAFRVSKTKKLHLIREANEKYKKSCDELNALIKEIKK